MKSLFFEDPFWLYALALLAEVVLVIQWRRRGDRQSALRLLIPPAAAALIFALATLVVTDRERLQEATRKIVKTLNAGQTSELASRLTSDFKGTFRGQPPFTREQAVGQIKTAFQLNGVPKITIESLKIEVTGKVATARILTLIELHGRLFHGRFPARWTLEWVKEGGRWLIRDARGP